MLEEHAELERALADPAVHADAAQPASSAGATPSSARSSPPPASWRPRATTSRRPGAGRRGPVVRRGGRASSTPASRLLETRLAELLVPRDPHDGDDVVLEVKSGEGGEESALFAGDLVRMYLRYAERRGWKAEILGGTDSDLGGYKDSRCWSARGRATPTACGPR